VCVCKRERQKVGQIEREIERERERERPVNGDERCALITFFAVSSGKIEAVDAARCPQAKINFTACRVP